MDNMCKFKILSITHTTIILRKPIYLNKLLNELLMRNTRLQYSNLFLVPKIHLMRIKKRSFGWAAPYMWNSLPSHYDAQGVKLNSRGNCELCC